MKIYNYNVTKFKLNLKTLLLENGLKNITHVLLQNGFVVFNTFFLMLP